MHRLQGASRGLDVVCRYVRKQLVEQFGFAGANFSEQLATHVSEGEQGRTLVARVRARFEKPVFEQGIDCLLYTSDAADDNRVV